MKQTEVGLIPDDWEVKNIEEFADVTTGNKNTQDAVENGKYPFYVRSPIVERINSFSFDSEGIITAGDGVGTGKVFHYAKGKFGLHQRAYLIHNFRGVDPKYFYFIFSKNFYERVHSMTAKSSVDSVRREMITKMEIPLPPPLEQQRIAKALSDVDSVITTLEKLIEKKKNIKQGTMQQLLTGKKRLPSFATTTATKQTELGEIPADWEVKNLGEICDLINGDRSSKYPKDDEMVSSGIPFINAGHLKEGAVDFDEMDYITRNHYQSLSGAKIREGDILFCLRGSLGKNALVDFNDGAPASSLCVIRHKTINEKLLFQIINSALFDKQIIDANSGSSQPNLSAKEVSNFLIPIPTSKEEQTAIANVLSGMDKEIETLNTKLEKYRNLKTAMMQQLLTGKIRLISSKANEAIFEKKQHTTNPAFKRSVLAAEIVNRLYNEPTFGHVKLQKLIFLTERMCGIDIDSSYHRDAAGPYDNYGMRSIDSQLKKQKWFSAEFTGSGYHYNPLENQGGHKKYFERYFADKKDTFDLIIQTFKPLKTEQCEIIATLYSAWEDFLKKGVNPNDEQIITDVLTNWHESKKRIPKYRWINALSWMKNKNFIPS